MLIVDGEKGQAIRERDTIERTRQFTADAALGEARDARWVSDKKRSVANADYQDGKRLQSTEFMRKLRTINADLTLEPHPGVSAPKDTAFHKHNFDKACMTLNTGGKKIFLFVCEGDYMPEWTVFNTKTVQVPNGTPEGVWKKTEIPWNKVKRGWREVLVLLIHKKLVGLEAVERVFGAGNRPSWRTLTGKGSGTDIF